MKLYVGNLAWTVTAEDLDELFGRHGTVRSASLVEDRETGRSRGFGFVEMSSEAEGREAIAKLDGLDLKGRPIRVNEALSKGPAPRRGR